MENTYHDVKRSIYRHGFPSDFTIVIAFGFKLDFARNSAIAL